jgi:nickel/cobalt transporter (NicO) family protein
MGNRMCDSPLAAGQGAWNDPAMNAFAPSLATPVRYGRRQGVAAVPMRSLLPWLVLLLLFLPVVGQACVSCLGEDPFAPLPLAPTAPVAAVGEPAAPMVVVEQSAIRQATAWLLQTQRAMHRGLTDTLTRLREAPSAGTALVLVLFGFLYGVFHAAGPGHGKAVISAYLLTHRDDLWRGLALSATAALMQALTAILLVGLLVGLLGWLLRDAEGQVRWLEFASFLLIIALGAWLSLRALRSLWRLRSTPAAATYRRMTGDGGANVAATALQARTPVAGPAPLRPVPQAAAADCDCGGAHHVDPRARGPWWATVLAVGIRPCSGAVIVLGAATLVGLWAAGVAAVLAMAVGTALTVSAFAVAAVLARDRVQRWAGRAAVPGLRYLGPAAGLAGGVVIAVVGWMLLDGALQIDAAARAQAGLF